MKSNIAYWRFVLREAKQELDAATTAAVLKAAGSKLMRANAELKRLSAEIGHESGVELRSRRGAVSITAPAKLMAWS
jgi:hypothetical protein